MTEIEFKFAIIGKIIYIIPLPTTEIDRIKYRALMLAMYEYFGVTEDEWLDYIEKNIVGKCV